MAPNKNIAAIKQALELLREADAALNGGDKGLAAILMRDAISALEGSQPKELTDEEPVAFGTHTRRVYDKWHAGITIDNQSFTLSANEGTEQEANWYSEMAMKALQKLNAPNARSVSIDTIMDVIKEWIKASVDGSPIDDDEWKDDEWLKAAADLRERLEKLTQQQAQ